MKKYFSIVSLILIILCGVIFTGCGPTYSSLKLSMEYTSLKLSINDESKEFEFKVENYENQKVEFNLGFDNNIAIIVNNSLTHRGNGVFTFSIAPILAGNANLNISLKGSDSSITIPVYITKEVTNFEPKEKLYVEVGTNGLNLNSKLFNFTPSDTTETNMEFVLPDSNNTQDSQYILSNADKEKVGLNNNKLTINSQLSSGNSFYILAICKDSNGAEKIKKYLPVEVVNEVSLTNFKFNLNNTEHFVYSNDNVTADNVVYNNFIANEIYNISLSTTDSNSFQKIIEVNKDAFNNSLYKIEVTTTNNVYCGGNESQKTILDYNKNSFAISTYKTGVSKLSFKVYNAEYPRIYKTIVFNVVVKDDPSIIRFKSSDGRFDQPHTQNLFTNSNEHKSFELDILPSTANKNDYRYFLKLEIKYENRDAFVEIKHNEIPNPEKFELKNYGIELIYGKNANNSDYYLNYSQEIDKDVLNKLSNSIKIKANNLALTDVSGYGKVEHIKISIICSEINNELDIYTPSENSFAQNSITFDIKEGIEYFGINSDYTKQGPAQIYLCLNQADNYNVFNQGGNLDNLFKGIDITDPKNKPVVPDGAEDPDDSRDIGKLKITALGSSVCTITQYSFNNKDTKNLEIYPTKLGECTYKIQTENGLSLQLKVIVYKSLSINNSGFKLNLDLQSNNNIIETTYDASQNLKSIKLKGSNQTFKLQASVEGENIDELSFNYKITSASSNIKINGLNITCNSYSVANLNVVIYNKIVPLNADQFLIDLISMQSETTVNTFTVQCINYVKELNVTAINGYDINGNNTKSVDIYNLNELSYFNKNLSYVDLYISARKDDGENEYNNIFAGQDLTSKYSELINNFKVTTNSLQINLDIQNGLIVLEENSYNTIIGTIQLFDLTDKDGQKVPFARFTYDNKSKLEISQILIIYSFTDKQINKTFSSSVTLNVQKHILVDQLWLSNPLNYIYLDNTESNRQVSFDTYVIPSNAMIKDVRVEIVSASDCVDQVVEGGKVTLIYKQSGVGKINIYPVSRMKTDEFKSEYNPISIPFRCADGETEATALKISNFKDLKNLDIEKHYYVDSAIDCKGEVLSFTTFGKTIRGTFFHEPVRSEYASDEEYLTALEDFKNCAQLGSIKNFKVEDITNVSVGMFGTLGSTAKIYNLTFSGEFVDKTFTFSNDSAYIGLLCGQNNGTIKNVTVNYVKTSSNKYIDIQSNKDVYVGIVAGLNQGTILIDDNSKQQTVLAISEKDNLVISCNNTTGSYVGGICGKNQGTIKQALSRKYKIGQYGISANVYIKANTAYLAGAVGYNVGTLTGLTVNGELDGRSINKTSAQNVAGFIGLNNSSNVENNNSRVFVRSSNNVAGFVSKQDSNTINSGANNKVQAIDDGTRLGVDASLIIFTKSNSCTTKEDGVTYETYFDRSKIDYSSSNKESQELSYSYYYGNIIRSDANGISDLEYSNPIFTKQTVENIQTHLSSLVIAGFKQAVDQNKQALINNKIGLSELLSYLQVNQTEITINVQNSNLAVINNYTSKMDIKGVGRITLKVNSSLNYNVATTFDLIIINYFEEIGVYANQDYIVGVNDYEIINNTTKDFYIRAYSNSYNYRNTEIKLQDCKDLIFECVTVDLNNVNIQLLGQKLFISSSLTTNTSKQLDFNAKYIYGNTTYYFYAKGDEGKLTQNKNELQVLTLVPENSEDDYIEDNKYTKQQEFDFVKGIENIRTNKVEVQAEPSDSIEITLTYDNYSANDKINVILEVVDKDNKTIVLTSNFINDNTIKFTHILDEWFNLIVGEPVLKTGTSNTYTQQYTLKMILTDSEVYKNIMSLKSIQLKFSNSSSIENVSTDIIYSPEQISSVLISNYSYEPDLISYDVNSNLELDLNKQIHTSKQIATGDINVLNAYVYTSYSEFDYVDISIPLQGASVSHIKYGLDNKGRISENILYISNTNGVTMRLYKKDIQNSTNDNTLFIGLIYSIPRSVADGTIVQVIFNFYNNANQIVYTKQTNLISRLANQVNFDIVNKQRNADNSYNLVRGKTYLLDVFAVGYENQDEFKFKSDNPIVSINNIGGEYYLTVNEDGLNFTDKYIPVTITSYGEKTTNGSVAKSRDTITTLNIYEYLVLQDEGKVDFANNQISIRVLEKTSIKNLIANKIQFEYSPVVEQDINTFKQNLYNNAKWYLVSTNQDKTQVQTKEITNITSSYETLGDFKFIIQDNDGYNEIYLISQTEKSNNTFEVVVEFELSYENGKPIIVTGSDISYAQEYRFNVTGYLQTTGDIPNPISSYEELKQMLPNEHYRLSNDIEVNVNNFEMITTEVASLDGNGHTIKIYGGELQVVDVSNFALFQTVAENAVFKNIKIAIDSKLTINYSVSSDSSGCNISILASENYGVITNCSIVSVGAGKIEVNILATLNVMKNTYFAPICTKNEGYITHCQVECDIKIANGNIAGVVAENNGHIASTYIKNSNISNVGQASTESVFTGGFVVKNSGSIFASYIEGSTINASKIYCTYDETKDLTVSKIINTNTKSGAFAYQNSGTIQDCYSNIPFSENGINAGFVYETFENSVIQRVFSLCKMRTHNTQSFAFIQAYDVNSIFEDCFFVYENGVINDNTSSTNYQKDENGNIVSRIPGITPLKIEDFNVVDKDGKLKQNTYFKNFITQEKYSNNMLSGVWFYSFDAGKESLATNSTYTNSVSELGKLSISKEGNSTNISTNEQFVARRLQLVSPNLISYSNYTFEEKDGKYIYTNNITNNQLGSIHNPYIISNVEELETYLNTDGKSYEDIQFNYIRLVKDIDYTAEEVYKSKLFNSTLFGYFEGNNLSISNYSVNTINSNNTTGYIANIGKSSTGETSRTISTVKNLKLIPQYINSPNSTYVGGFAGSVNNANIYNVQMENSNIIVSGKNVVGGLFGTTTGRVRMNSIYANISSRASYISPLLTTKNISIQKVKDQITLNTNSTNKSLVSYAGTIVGYADGETIINNVNIGPESRVYGMISGLIVGGLSGRSVIDNGLTTVQSQTVNIYNKSSINNTIINISDNMRIVGHAFAGVIAGQNNGTIKNVELNSTVVGDKLFSCYPIVPKGIGGIAGLSVSGKFNNIYTKEGYSVLGAEYQENGNVRNPFIAYSVGGVVGVAYGNTYVGYTTETTPECNGIYLNSGTKGILISGGRNVGGVIGLVVGENTKIANTKLKLQTEENIYFSRLSSVVGENVQDYADIFDSENNNQKFGLIVGETVKEILEGDVSLEQITANIALINKVGNEEDATLSATNSVEINGTLKIHSELYNFAGGNFTEASGNYNHEDNYMMFMDMLSGLNVKGLLTEANKQLLPKIQYSVTDLSEQVTITGNYSIVINSDTYSIFYIDKNYLSGLNTLTLNKQ